jgi:hypothetical protein
LELPGGGQCRQQCGRNQNKHALFRFGTAGKLTRAILRGRQLERLVDAGENLEKLDDVSRIGDYLRGE